MPECLVISVSVSIFGLVPECLVISVSILYCAVCKLFCLSFYAHLCFTCVLFSCVCSPGTCPSIGLPG